LANGSYSLTGIQMVRYGDGVNWHYKQDSGAGQCTAGYMYDWEIRISECQAFTPAVATNSSPAVGNLPAIDKNKIPFSNPAYSTARLQATTELPVPTDIGAFRISCKYTHMSFDDPVVFPGQPNATHLHTFYGNSKTDAFSTTKTLAASGDSSCDGGTINRSAYWVPSMIDTGSGTPIVSDRIGIYYKSGYGGVLPAQVQPWPAGLRMIAGNPKGYSQATSLASGFECMDVPAGVVNPTSGKRVPEIPNCPVGSYIHMTIDFPQCWDGVNLDSPDHRSHMAYPTGSGCPNTHPVPLPIVTYNLKYPVKESNAPLRWRLSSDNYASTVPGGYSAHADWMNGWDQDIISAWTKNCVQASVDCHAYLLGDGRKFY
jgi:hypothetical protein